MQYKNSQKLDELYAPICFKFFIIVVTEVDNRRRRQAFVALQRRSSKYIRFKSKSIEAVRKSYFPQFPYRNFAPLFCKKLRKWNIETSLAGKRKAVRGEKKGSKYILSLLVLSLVFPPTTSQCSTSSTSYKREEQSFYMETVGNSSF